MSYCRWSSDNFACDLYCYESREGFVTHVATNKVLGDIPKLPEWSPGTDVLVWGPLMVQQSKAQHDFLATCERVPIGLPYDGETFVDEDLGAFLERLIELRTLGYQFPAHLIDEVREALLEQVRQEQAVEG